jgi:hypothetical protein
MNLHIETSLAHIQDFASKQDCHKVYHCTRSGNPTREVLENIEGLIEDIKQAVNV